MKRDDNNFHVVYTCLINDQDNNAGLSSLNLDHHDRTDTANNVFLIAARQSTRYQTLTLVHLRQEQSPH